MLQGSVNDTFGQHCAFCCKYSALILNTTNSSMFVREVYVIHSVKPGFHISQFIGVLLSGIAEGENVSETQRILSIVDHRQ